MSRYNLPVADMLFLQSQVFASEIAGLTGAEDLGPETVEAIADAIGAFAAERVLPLAESADAMGCRLKDGRVLTPDGYPALWKAFCEDGWNGLPFASEWGGQGLPNFIHYILREAMISTGMAFSLFHELGFGVAKAVQKHGSAWMKSTVLPRLASGEWAGTMNLTEPHCGSDLGLIRTKATRNPDGTYTITGDKIFITGGDHDLTANIMHLVLARVDGAPAGVGGISLFLVPKIMIGEDGAPLAPNTLHAVAIEKKMGIHGSPTCVMRFENAVGWLVGEENKGLGHMFTMMNAARLSVGVQGVAIGETALQMAETYATDRLQGKAAASPTTVKGPDPIILHPDVRRELLSMRALVEGGRAFGWWIALELDTLDRHPDATRRDRADANLALLTPIFKSALSDMGFDVAARAMMIHGGHGYIKEMGVERLVRDVRISGIYEGANGIQARDLVLRKVPAGKGGDLENLLTDLGQMIPADLEEDLALALRQSLKSLRRTSDWVLKYGEINPDLVLGSSHDYLSQFALTIMGVLWGHMAGAARNGDTPFNKRKIETARFYIQRILPKAEYHATVITAGPVPLITPVN